MIRYLLFVKQAFNRLVKVISNWYKNILVFFGTWDNIRVLEIKQI